MVALTTMYAMTQTHPRARRTESLQSAAQTAVALQIMNTSHSIAATSLSAPIARRWHMDLARLTIGVPVLAPATSAATITC
jgi:hypothetical protein